MIASPWGRVGRRRRHRGRYDGCVLYHKETSTLFHTCCSTLASGHWLPTIKALTSIERWSQWEPRRQPPSPSRRQWDESRDKEGGTSPPEAVPEGALTAPPPPSPVKPPPPAVCSGEAWASSKSGLRAALRYIINQRKG